jgi:hypothetical protein
LLNLVTNLRWVHTLNLELREVFGTGQKRDVFEDSHQIESRHWDTTSCNDAENLFPHHRLRKPVNGEGSVDGDEVIRTRNVFRTDFNGRFRVHQIARNTENLISFIFLLRCLEQFHRQRREAHCGVVFRVGFHPVDGEIGCNP